MMCAAYRSCLVFSTFPNVKRSSPVSPGTWVFTIVTGIRTTQVIHQIGRNMKAIIRRKRTKK